MKKILFASTALVAAGLMTTGTASAAEKIKLQLGGYSKWWVVGQWVDSGYGQNGTTGPATSYNNVDVKGDNEIWFTGSTTLDNGLKVGVTVELEAGGFRETGGNQTTTGDIIDASYAWVEGGFGKVVVGTQFNGAFILHVTAPEAAGNHGPEGLLTAGLAIPRPANTTVTGVGFGGGLHPGGGTTGILTPDKAEMITYVAPTFGGLTVGATYIPNIASEDQRASASNDTEVFGAGALFAQTFGSVGVKVSAGFASYDGGTAYTRGYEASAGTQVSVAGFTVGGSIKKANENLKGVTDKTNSAAEPTVSGAGISWDAGIMYANGPMSVSFYYMRSEAEGAINSGTDVGNGKDTFDVYQVSGKYTMGPGVDLLGTVGYVKNRDGDAAASAGGDGRNNEGWIVATGLSLSF